MNIVYKNGTNLLVLDDSLERRLNREYFAKIVKNTSTYRYFHVNGAAVYTGCGITKQYQQLYQ